MTLLPVGRGKFSKNKLSLHCEDCYGYINSGWKCYMTNIWQKLYCENYKFVIEERDKVLVACKDPTMLQHHEYYDDKELP